MIEYQAKDKAIESYTLWNIGHMLLLLKPDGLVI